MYQSNRRILTRNSQRLHTDVKELLHTKKKIRCKSLGRFISLQKLPEAIVNRRDSKRRLQSFWVALDIVKHAPSYRNVIIDGYRCFELRGVDALGAVVIVHLREEHVQKDRIVYFVSCMPK